MVYYRVPVVNGALDIDYSYLQEGLHFTQNECYVKLRDGAAPRLTWQEITEEEFNLAKESLSSPPA